ncbi:Glyoxalase/Bleomycin resistance protein/Dihydroxybiphenyl dioxygenase [Dunaliella salina]|uniref:Glyoxalase/Bleomycin resistance protein/Dihydroxybiphenyl dioxygenase n=1 Tax=Dunaliella salina TaxID=3046 RepID=A0ABQ7H8N4_DUNSA|nr:Glyoxalase/Bleomycin resistance protein/Dihydroxybiphenyl dioxygenase [Dunaliella salina]|eukprot:KAF5843193.1 Glyoxalase/Bleomycin resistance protein/Dihydroxybiphenyl dioxygenase [Dunaliella salina]
MGTALNLKCLNHISIKVHDVDASTFFYTKVLGFTLVKRPSSFRFNGAWLHNYGLGIHLIGGGPKREPMPINPRNDHLSFQAASSTSEIQAQLEKMAIPYLKEVVVEDGMCVTQLFFHDPDNMMIEICNCELLPVVPATADRAASLDAQTLKILERLQKEEEGDHPMDGQVAGSGNSGLLGAQVPRPPSSTSNSSSRSSMESVWAQHAHAPSAHVH